LHVDLDIQGSVGPTHQVSNVYSIQEERDGLGMLQTGFWWKNLRKEDHWGDPGIHGRIISKWIFKKWDGYGPD